MAAVQDGRAETALTRFGLGSRPGDVSKISNDPNGFVVAQLDDPAAPLLGERLPGTRAILTAQEALLAGRRDGEEGLDPREETQATYRRDVAARVSRAVATDRPFVERLVFFWSNFFTVSTDKGMRLRLTAGAFEREAIRPHVLGRFADMLVAATKHPAMLTYLDNDRSIGPGSPRRRRGRQGLTENLARETLELHSVGVDGGYDQTDVTELAAALTGWQGLSARRGGAGTFFFEASAHEPGARTILGRRYAMAGVRQGEAVLADLARAPATADHVARRLAAHFVADDAPAALVARLARTFRESDGDLRAVALTLAGAQEAWTTPPRKFIPPFDLVVAAHRLTGVVPDERMVIAASAGLGQPVWSAPSPKGWPEGDADWVAPDALIERLDWLTRIAEAADVADVEELAAGALGSRLRPETREAVQRAESRAQALALLMASSEFQTR